MKRISLRTSSVLAKMEPEPDLYTGSDQCIGSSTLAVAIPQWEVIFGNNTTYSIYFRVL